MGGRTGRIALTRDISPHIERCVLTHVARVPIDVGRALAQHRAYEEALRAIGCEVRRLPHEPDLPDAVFVEDTAVIFEELAVVTRPGAEICAESGPSVRHTTDATLLVSMPTARKVAGVLSL